jgi:hypothetical protein
MTIRGIMLRTVFAALLCCWMMHEPTHLKSHARYPHWFQVLVIGGMCWLEFELLNWANRSEDNATSE